MRHGTEYDIILIGCGLVGSSFLLNLKNKTQRIAVIEQHAADHPSTQTRPITLAHGSLSRLAPIKSALLTTARPIQSLCVSQAASLGHLCFHAKDYDIDALAYTLPFHTLYNTLRAHHSHHAGLTWHVSQQIKQINNHAAGATVEYQDTQGQTQCISAPLLVCADGTGSPARTQLGIEITTTSTDAIAAVFQITTQGSRRYDAYQRFTRLGSLAYLPADAKQGYVVWTLSKPTLDALPLSDPTALTQQLSSLYQGRLGKVIHAHYQQHYPLSECLANTLTQQSAVLIGNAAQTLLPIAAQGFNVGLGQAHQLASLLNDTTAPLTPCQRDALLSTYAQKVLPMRAPLIKHMQQIQRWFHTPSRWLSPIQSVILAGIHLTPPLKKKIATGFFHG
jgi:ubiquinone biosynthesis UbiH/UbiF/VisC/COQ6 family hydroxylase